MPSERTRMLIVALKNNGTRSCAAFMLANEQPRDAGAPLAQLLDERNDHLRTTAAQRLGSLGLVERAVFERLRHTAQNDRHPIVRGNAIESRQRLRVMTDTTTEVSM